jgi:hypothetical protein
MLLKQCPGGDCTDRCYGPIKDDPTYPTANERLWHCCCHFQDTEFAFDGGTLHQANGYRIVGNTTVAQQAEIGSNLRCKFAHYLAPPGFGAWQLDTVDPRPPSGRIETLWTLDYTIPTSPLVADSFVYRRGWAWIYEGFSWQPNGADKPIVRWRCDSAREYIRLENNVNGQQVAEKGNVATAGGNAAPSTVRLAVRQGDNVGIVSFGSSFIRGDLTGGSGAADRRLENWIRNFNHTNSSGASGLLVLYPSNLTSADWPDASDPSDSLATWNLDLSEGADPIYFGFGRIDGSSHQQVGTTIQANTVTEVEEITWVDNFCLRIDIEKAILGTATLISATPIGSGVVRITFRYTTSPSGLTPVSFSAERTRGPTSPAAASVLWSAGTVINPTTREFVVDTPALTPDEIYRYQIVAVNGTNRVKVITCVELTATA